MAVSLSLVDCDGLGNGENQLHMSRFGGLVHAFEALVSRFCQNAWLLAPLNVMPVKLFFTWTIRPSGCPVWTFPNREVQPGHPDTPEGRMVQVCCVVSFGASFHPQPYGTSTTQAIASSTLRPFLSVPTRKRRVNDEGRLGRRRPTHRSTRDCNLVPPMRSSVLGSPAI